MAANITPSPINLHEQFQSPIENDNALVNTAYAGKPANLNANKFIEKSIRFRFEAGKSLADVQNWKQCSQAEMSAMLQQLLLYKQQPTPGSLATQKKGCKGTSQGAVQTNSHDDSAFISHNQATSRDRVPA